MKGVPVTTLRVVIDIDPESKNATVIRVEINPEEAPTDDRDETT